MVFGWPWKLFTYGVARDFDSPRFTAALLICGAVWVSFATILSIATVGYEYRPVRTTDFNGTNELWYEKFFVHTPWNPQTKTCESAMIKPGDGIPCLRDCAKDSHSNRKCHVCPCWVSGSWIRPNSRNDGIPELLS